MDEDGLPIIGPGVDFNKRAETALTLLENKLSYIPGLEDVTAPDAAPGAAPQAVAAAPAASSAAAPAAPAASDAAATGQPPAPAAEAAAPQMTVKQHPDYAKYFKMVGLGVPEQAVKNKMRAEGMDPNLLDTPDAPAPEVTKKDDDDDIFDDASSQSSFSD